MLPDPTPVQRMENMMRAYFQSEKNGGVFLLVWGIIASTAGCYLFSCVDGFLEKGIAYPLVAIAMIHLVTGGIIYFRTDAQLRALLKGLELTPREMLAEEIPRMQTVMAKFERFKMVELTLVFLGLIFAIGGSLGGFGQFMFGTGVGLSLQSAISLIFDLFAAQRGGFYLHELNKFERNSL